MFIPYDLLLENDLQFADTLRFVDTSLLFTDWTI